VRKELWDQSCDPKKRALQGNQGESCYILFLNIGIMYTERMFDECLRNCMKVSSRQTHICLWLRDKCAGGNGIFGIFDGIFQDLSVPALKLRSSLEMIESRISGRYFKRVCHYY